MKQCPSCGNKYNDELQVCIVDGNSLLQFNPDADTLTLAMSGEEQRVRDIFWEELSTFLHEIEQEAGEPESDNGDTKTARGLLRLLFNSARTHHIKNIADSGELDRISKDES